MSPTRKHVDSTIGAREVYRQQLTTFRILPYSLQIEPLLRLPHADEKLELVEADLLKPDNWTE